MPALVVRDVAASLAETGGHVVAGATASGLDRAVAGVARPRRLATREQDPFDLHDLVVVTNDVFVASADISLATLIGWLAESQAGLIVAGLSDRAAARDLAPYQVADERGFPLIAVPDTVDLSAMTSHIIDLIRERQALAARSVREALAAVGRARDPHDPLGALGQALARCTGLVFLLENEHHVAMAQALPDPSPCAPDAVAAALASHAARKLVRPATPNVLSEDYAIQRHLPGRLARAIVPLSSSEAPIAYLGLIGPDSRVTPREIDVLLRVAPSFAFELGKRRTAETETRRTAATDLAAILAGALPEPEALRRAIERQHDLSAPHVMAFALPAGANGAPDAWAAAEAERLALLAPPAWTTAHGVGMAVALAAADDEHARAQVARLFDGAVAVGLGRAATGAAGLGQSLAEAREAAIIGGHLALPVTSFADLGLWRLLFALRERDALQAFCRETLDPLLRADAHQGDELLATLDAWFTANGNLSGAAHRLGKHRNTMAYRLNRIQQTLGASLDDPELRLALHVALKIWRMRPR